MSFYKKSDNEVDLKLKADAFVVLRILSAAYAKIQETPKEEWSKTDEIALDLVRSLEREINKKLT